MNILKVKIPVGSDGSVKKAFLVNPSGEKGVGCADGCIKIVLDDNMMDQIRSFKASPNHLNLDIIPMDIIPGKTDPYLIVDKSRNIFWVGGVDPTKLWTPGGNTKGQYKEIKRKDGTIIYKLDEQLGQTVPPDSESKINAYVEQKWVPYPLVPSTNISATYKYIPTSQKAGKSKKRRTRRLKKKRKKKQTKKRKKKRRTKKRYKRRKKKSVRKRGKKKN